MKTKVTAAILFLIIATSVNAQIKDTLSLKLSDHDLGVMYLEKSKSQKTAAWVLLGVGLAGWIGGAVAYANAWDDYGWDGSSSDPGTGALVVQVIGFGCTIASVPFFISAAKNKGRAEILLRNENIMMGYNYRNVQSIPSIGISIPIGTR